MDYILRKSLRDEDAYTVRRRLSRRYPAINLPALAFADDAALLSDTPEAARQLLRFEEASASVGLKFNKSKTKVMRIGATSASPISTSDGTMLEDVTNFKYLGCSVRDCSSAFRDRRRLAWTAARRLDVVWGSGVSDALEMQLFKACIESILLYSAEAWTLTATLGGKIFASHRDLLRHAIGVHYPDIIGNKELYERCAMKPATLTITASRQRLISHVLRRPETPLAELMTAGPVTEPFRREGNLRKQWTSNCDNTPGLRRRQPGHASL